MTLLERLAELRLHLAHLREIRPRVRSATDLETDLSLRNDEEFADRLAEHLAE